MYDLKHPSTGCYEAGAADIYWHFMDDIDSDSDGGGDDCGALAVDKLLAYHLTVLRGFDVDQPRNLAKSVTTQ
ncbi:hypothetical protein C2845_PM06G14960 [Panicum miliaceum]|uniref:Uncharacterized protein n=1 Tax=Panicum miliaceum TaxID=4540 RepID=A0A3L6RB55_PANMI|nr:hypothetical protein C2845_PM06G14960 [Panicum miliaceum]